ncbi:hypothetical protein Tco_0853174, partial [Tanacetum coccineum]
APRSANNPAYEKDGMQVLSREDTESLNLCKTMMKRGECPPLMVVFDPVEGKGERNRTLDCVRYNVELKPGCCYTNSRHIKGRTIGTRYNAYDMSTHEHWY